MEYIYIRIEGDMQTLTEHVKEFGACSNEDLILSYNKQARCGITGVHSQALYLISMGHVFLKRFGKSPISLEENVLDIKGQIKLVGETFEYIEK
jgi:hypothetical protein